MVEFSQPEFAFILLKTLALELAGLVFHRKIDNFTASEGVRTISVLLTVHYGIFSDWHKWGQLYAFSRV
jgi:hypothetical protein